jgi:tripartite ATP-independent transporter DctM subunit
LIWIFLLALFGLVIIGTPISFALAIVGAILALIQGMSLSVIVQHAIAGMNSFPLLAIPFFMLLGEIMNKSSISKKLVKLADSLVGFINGGLGIGAVLASMFMGGISGSAVADSSAIGGILIPPMVEEKYSRREAAAIIASSSTIGIIIPPSVPFILFGFITGTSISKMFLGGIIPGILMGFALIAITFIRAKRNNDGVNTKKFSWENMLDALKDSYLTLLLPVVVVIGIMTGIFTPTEAGAIASAIALILSLFIYKDITIMDIPKLFISSARVTASVLFLIATATGVAWLLTIARVPDSIVDILHSVSNNSFVILIVIHVFLLFIGCVMDLTPALLILAPILLPVARELGLDPVFFGVTMCVNLGIGLVTPPVGTILYIVSGVAKVSLEEIIKSIWPYLIVMVIILLILLVFPQIVTCIPHLVF